MKKNFGFYFSIQIFLILVGFIAFSPGYHFVDFINVVFIISFVYLILTLFLYTKRGGFYDGIAFGFRKFRSLMAKERDELEEWKYKALPSQNVSGRLYNIVKVQTIALLTLLFILMLFYYA